MNEVPDEPVAAATRGTIAHGTDTVGHGRCSALTPGQIICPVVIAEMTLVSGFCLTVVCLPGFSFFSFFYK